MDTQTINNGDKKSKVSEAMKKVAPAAAGVAAGVGSELNDASGLDDTSDIDSLNLL